MRDESAVRRRGGAPLGTSARVCRRMRGSPRLCAGCAKHGARAGGPPATGPLQRTSGSPKRTNAPAALAPTTTRDGAHPEPHESAPALSPRCPGRAPTRSAPAEAARTATPSPRRPEVRLTAPRLDGPPHWSYRCDPGGCAARCARSSTGIGERAPGGGTLVTHRDRLGDRHVQPEPGRHRGVSPRRSVVRPPRRAARPRRSSRAARPRPPRTRSRRGRSPRRRA
ncbi:MAG: hypothetical protein QOG35_2602 [Solirubrobacteraceae bacterium]|nr:hypothetical protein [Solirubrobacteraceae bacterium]